MTLTFAGDDLEPPDFSLEVTESFESSSDSLLYTWSFSYLRKWARFFLGRPRKLGATKGEYHNDKYFLNILQRL